MLDGGDHFVTVQAILATVNTALLIGAGFLFRDAWKNIHERIDGLESASRDTREQVSRLEGVVYGRRFGERERGTT